jgi:hypothetical protein
MHLQLAARIFHSMVAAKGNHRLLHKCSQDQPREATFNLSILVYLAICQHGFAAWFILAFCS